MKKLLLCVLLCAVATYTQAADMQPQDYIEAFTKLSILQKPEKVEPLEWAGLSDPKIFDLLEKDVLDNYKTADSSGLIKALNWEVRGLGFSGNEKYIPTLQAVAKDGVHRNLRKYAEQAIADIGNYKQWNPLINPNHNNTNVAYPSDKQRYVNMLNSGNYELMRIAAKRIHWEHLYEHDILDVTAKAVEAYYQQANDDLSIDSVAWMVRAVAGSKDPKYKPLVENVAANAENKKVKKYAKKYLSYYE